MLHSLLHIRKSGFQTAVDGTNTGKIKMIRLLPRSPVVFGLFIGAAYFLFSRPKPVCAQGKNVEVSSESPLIIIVGLFEVDDDRLIQIFDETLKAYKSTENIDAEFKFVPIKVPHGDEFPAYTQVCQQLQTEGISLVADVTWEGWVHAQSISSAMDLPYIKIDVTNGNFITALELYLRHLEATNAAMIFPDEKQLDQALNYLVGNTVVRIIVVDGSKDDSMKKLSMRRPAPTYLAFVGSTDEVDNLVAKAIRLNMLHEESRSIIVQQDPRDLDFDKIEGHTSSVQPTAYFCCSLDGWPGNKDECKCTKQEKIIYGERFLKSAVMSIGDKFKEMRATKNAVTGIIEKCGNSTNTLPPEKSTLRHTAFMNSIETVARKRGAIMKGLVMHWNSELSCRYRHNDSFPEVAKWTITGFVASNDDAIRKFRKKYFRVGSVWMFVLGCSVYV